MGKILRLIIRSQWDRALALATTLLALVALLLGWIGVASTSFPAEQVPYVVSGGIFGIFLVVTAATLWISADIRDEWRKLHEVSHKLDELQISLESAMVSVSGVDTTGEMPANRDESPNSKPRKVTSNRRANDGG
jgi:hypothetical protein